MIIQITIHWFIKIHMHFQGNTSVFLKYESCCFFTFMDGFSKDVTLQVINWGLSQIFGNTFPLVHYNSSCRMNWFIMYGLILSQYTVHSKIQIIFLRYIKSHWLLISSHRYHMSPISLDEKVCTRLTCSLSLPCQWIMVMHKPVILSNSHGMKYRNSWNTSTWVTHTYKNNKR